MNSYANRLKASSLMLGLGLVWPVAAEVTVFQNGVSPTPAYAGCADTVITPTPYEAKRNYGQHGEVAARDRRLLLRFDLSAIPASHVVSRSLLRICATTPMDPKAGVTCMAPARAWDDSANWWEPRFVDFSSGKETSWKKDGGDFDVETMYGNRTGVVDAAAIKATPHGQVFELDVTPLVARQVSGAVSNYGFGVFFRSSGSLAMAEWIAPRYRPLLAVEHCEAGEVPKEPTLAPVPGAPNELELSPLAGTQDRGGAEAETAEEGWGKAAGCSHDGLQDAYVKEDPRCSGTFGWLPYLRAGGMAGTSSRILIKPDLSALPKNASIRSAKLRLTLADARGVEGFRYGAYAMKGDWSPDEVTAAQSKSGAAWPGGDIFGNVEEHPVAWAQWKREKKNEPAPAPVLEWDLTGIVRAWAAGQTPNCGLLIDNRLEGGGFDAYSSRYRDPAVRPRLILSLAPGTSAKPLEPKMEDDGVPTGDYWVEPMRKVHARWNGKKGTLGQYGDSITITMAFLAPHGWGTLLQKEMKAAPDFVEDLKAIEPYMDRAFFRSAKGPQFGNEGRMTIEWCFGGIDGWQKSMNPEVAVILFGMNDGVAGLSPAVHGEMLASVCERIMADGGVPIVTTVPPHGDAKTDEGLLRRFQELRRVQIAVARAKHVPLIDFYGEIVARQPEDWNTTLMGSDKLHPSFPKPYRLDYTEEGLKNSGYTLRNYLTFRMYADIYRKVLK